VLTSLLGILGGICFAYCGVPAALATFKAKRSIGTPIFVALMIVLGSIFMYVYMTATYGLDLILTVNYAVQLLSWGLIVYYHYFPGVTYFKDTLGNVIKTISREEYESTSAIQGSKLEVEPLEIE